MNSPFSRKSSIEKSKLLFVEGKDEVIFFDSLLKHMGNQYHDEIQVVPYEGKAKLHNFISMISKTENFIENTISLVITRDADDDMTAAVSSINHTLKKVFDIDNVQHGEFYESDVIKVGVYILPGYVNKGELEDLVLNSLKGNNIYGLVDSYFVSLRHETQPENQQSEFHFPKKASKAKMQIYFSSMKESDARLGISAQRKYVDFDHQCFNDIKEFLMRL
ncbi:DUF3226 domain-containing protein [Atlantibacter hermannii]|uniref:DUF3226 domain-containing protein n=1 Tax=Atlantibacter hermannii TaxID=565 RepID=UPI0028A13425|nr:DUF3226 domain-containing protein [Atlantibacter hermannii]